ncbi:hypothetical protein FBT96_05870 [Rhodobacter capsulatus]|uniref:Uncharacterized protein n=1 Tax=Rhodobacter capsulatus TaxID=1061 RepID=A0A4U1JTX9_RHOCA|nr:hypothetical protein [Rhodobacter capsulatus]TKD22644.1 hypothetical protein FBT96_05870 [Rhodobacter capsulatus]
MVWTHSSAQPVATAAVIGPWLGRILIRLRAAFSPAPTASGWPAVVIAAADQPHGSGGATPGIRLQRIGRSAAPAHELAPPRPESPSALSPGAAPTGSATAPVAGAARFYGLDADSISVVYVLSHRGGAGLTCLDWLADHGLPFRRIGALHPTAPVWSAPQGALLLVDLDTLGGMSEMAEPLMRLRLGRPDIAVVLLSEEVETHDFGTERLVLADITLRLPCAFASFEFALAEAPINNAAWQERLLGDQR